jgi:hypothetical protein
MPEDDDDKGVPIQRLSDVQLIHILQLDDSDEDDPNGLKQLVEAEIARRKKKGGSH